MYNKKRAQSEIITTVLIILLVLAAIVIVWQVVKSTVSTGTEAVKSQSSCIGASIEVSTVGINSTRVVNNVSVSRGSDSVTIDSMKLVIETATGTVTTCDLAGTLPASLESKLLTTTGTCTTSILTSGVSYTVGIAPKISGTQCDVVASKTVTA